MGIGFKSAARWLGLLDDEDDELTTAVRVTSEERPVLTRNNLPFGESTDRTIATTCGDPTCFGYELIGVQSS